MIRIWAKIMKDGKIIKDTIYESFAPVSYTTFYESLVEICHSFDITTPVMIKKHFDNFNEFNNTRFLPRDFLEHVPFDYLVIENALL